MLVFGTFDLSEYSMSVLGDWPALVLGVLLTKSGLCTGGDCSPDVSVKNALCVLPTAATLKGTRSFP